MSKEERFAVVGDIGGTRARFGIADLDTLTIDRFARFDCADFSSAEAVLAAYLRGCPDHPLAASLAVAGAVADDAVEMTNLPWALSLKAVADLVGGHQVCLVNKYQATALALPHVGVDGVTAIGGNQPEPTAPKALLGAGTGLGMAFLVRSREQWTAVSGEGGHAAFAAQTDEEFDVLKRLRRDIGYISYEHMLSGGGLVRLYRLLRPGPDAPLVAEEVLRLALDDGDAAALRAVRLYAGWLGRFAGDMALLYGARGGIYLGGGIVPRMLTFLTDGLFRRAFEAKGQLADYVSGIPVYVIRTEQAALIGAAVAMAAQR